MGRVCERALLSVAPVALALSPKSGRASGTVKLPGQIVLWRLPGNGVGDNLFITAVAREIHAVDPSVSVSVVAKYGELFENNPHVSSFSTELRRFWMRRSLRHRLNKLPLPRRYYYMEYELGLGREHVLTQLSRRVLGPDYVPALQIDLHLEQSELDQVRPLVPDRPFVTTHSVGKTTFSSNKEWYPERFQTVVDSFAELPFVQVGQESDPPLRGCIDLRGKLTLRQLAAVIKLARLNLCQEGGLMHLAAAVGTHSVVIWGGFIHPEMTGYAENTNIVNQPSCSPCFPASTCPYDRKCMDRITADDVRERVTAALSAA